MNAESIRGLRRTRTAGFVACALMTVAFGARAAEDPAATLLGRWRSVATSRGGIGSMLELRHGGVVAYSPGAVVEMSYRIEGKQLVLPPATSAGPEQRETILWLTKDRIRLSSLEEPVSGEELARRSSSRNPANPILGEWIGARDMGGKKVDVLYFFYPGGKGLLLIPFLTRNGTYTVRGGKIHLALPDLPPADAAFRVEGNVLTLARSGSEETKYAKY